MAVPGFRACGLVLDDITRRARHLADRTPEPHDSSDLTRRIARSEQLASTDPSKAGTRQVVNTGRSQPTDLSCIRWTCRGFPGVIAEPGCLGIAWSARPVAHVYWMAA